MIVDWITDFESWLRNMRAAYPHTMALICENIGWIVSSILAVVGITIVWVRGRLSKPKAELYATTSILSKMLRIGSKLSNDKVEESNLWLELAIKGDKYNQICISSKCFGFKREAKCVSKLLHGAKDSVIEKEFIVHDSPKVFLEYREYHIDPGPSKSFYIRHLKPQCIWENIDKRDRNKYKIRAFVKTKDGNEINVKITKDLKDRIYNV